MPNLLAMSFEGTLAPSFDLRCLHPGRKPPDGWGIGYYPGGEPSASVLKEPGPASGSIRSELVKAWDHLASSLFVVHIRSATWGQNSDANTQPFSFPYGGRQWLFGHSGSLRERLVVSGRFEPIGSTDTELVFCDLLDRIAESGWRSIGEVDLGKLQLELHSLNAHGSLSLVMSDGLDLLVYSDARDDGGLHLAKLLPPHGPSLVFGDSDLLVDLMRRGEISRKGVLVSSSPLTREGPEPERTLEWTPIPAGHLLVVRQGAVVAEVGAAPSERSRLSERPSPLRRVRPVQAVPRHVETKRLEIVHRTTYTYALPVERSTHLLRLVPFHDRLQRLLDHTLIVSVDGEPIEPKQVEFDDVFGNRARRIMLEQPFRELVVEARSKV